MIKFADAEGVVKLRESRLFPSGEVAKGSIKGK